MDFFYLKITHFEPFSRYFIHNEQKELHSFLSVLFAQQSSTKCGNITQTPILIRIFKIHKNLSSLAAELTDLTHIMNDLTIHFDPP